MVFLGASPVVGEASNSSGAEVSDVYVGSQHVIGPSFFEGEYFYNVVETVASGVRVTYVRSLEVQAGEVITTDDIGINMYVITQDYEDGVSVYTSVTESDVEPSLAIRHSYDDDEFSNYDVLVTLTQPELDSDAGEILACYINVSTNNQPM